MAFKLKPCKECGEPFPPVNPSNLYCAICRPDPQHRSNGKGELEKLAPDPTELAQAFTALILHDGDATAASTQLERQNIYITIADLRRWRKDYSEKYNELAIGFEKAKEEAIIIMAREGASAALEASNYVLNERRAGMKSEDNPSRTALNLSKVAVNNANLMLTLQGRPSKFTASESPQQLLKTLEALGIAKRIEDDEEPLEGSFVEIPDQAAGDES